MSNKLDISALGSVRDTLENCVGTHGFTSLKRVNFVLSEHPLNYDRLAVQTMYLMEDARENPRLVRPLMDAAKRLSQGQYHLTTAARVFMDVANHSAPGSKHPDSEHVVKAVDGFYKILLAMPKSERNDFLKKEVLLYSSYEDLKNPIGNVARAVLKYEPETVTVQPASILEAFMNGAQHAAPNRVAALMYAAKHAGSEPTVPTSASPPPKASGPSQK